VSSRDVSAGRLRFLALLLPPERPVLPPSRGWLRRGSAAADCKGTQRHWVSSPAGGWLTLRYPFKASPPPPGPGGAATNRAPFHAVAVSRRTRHHIGLCTFQCAPAATARRRRRSGMRPTDVQSGGRLRNGIVQTRKNVATKTRSCVADFRDSSRSSGHWQT
jgi:hypothetical protein